jgi:hypothetical protein
VEENLGQNIQLLMNVKEFLSGECLWIFTKTETWASIADKLEPYCQNCGSPKNGYLAAGLCDPKTLVDFIKFVVMVLLLEILVLIMFKMI